MPTVDVAKDIIADLKKMAKELTATDAKKKQQNLMTKNDNKNITTDECHNHFWQITEKKTNIHSHSETDGEQANVLKKVYAEVGML